MKRENIVTSIFLIAAASIFSVPNFFIMGLEEKANIYYGFELVSLLVLFILIGLGYDKINIYLQERSDEKDIVKIYTKKHYQYFVLFHIVVILIHAALIIANYGKLHIDYQYLFSSVLMVFFVFDIWNSAFVYVKIKYFRQENKNTKFSGFTQVSVTFFSISLGAMIASWMPLVGVLVLLITVLVVRYIVLYEAKKLNQ